MTTPSHPRRELAATLAVAAGTLLFCALLLWRDPYYFWHDDYQMSGLGVFFDIARAYGRGELPLLTPGSWLCGNLAGEFQFGTFSPAQTLVVLLAVASGLSLPLTAAIYPLLHVALLSAGTFRLARGEGLSMPAGVLAAAAAALNGFSIAWMAPDWLSILSGFAWVPWAWWALAGTLRDNAPWRVAVAVLSLYAVLTAGWPLTMLMMGLLTLWLAARHLAERKPWAALWPLVASWVAALGLAAPALWLFVDYIRQTARFQVGTVWQHEWVVPPAGLWGLFNPGLGTPWLEFGRVNPHLPLELFNGVVPAALVLAAFVTRRRALVAAAGWELGLLLVVLALCLVPSVGIIRWSFRWLPLVHLLMGLVAARVLSQEAPGPTKTWEQPALWAIGLVGLSWVMALPDSPVDGRWGGQALLVLVVWGLLARRAAGAARAWAAPVSALALLGLTYWHVPNHLSVPVWAMTETLRRPEPLDPAVRYLGAATYRDYYNEAAFTRPFGAVLRPGNTPLIAGLEFINGYTPLGPGGLQQLLRPDTHGYLPPETIRWAIERAAVPNGLLALMGVDGLVLGPSATGLAPVALAHGWTKRAEGPDGLVLHRQGPASPRVRSLPGITLVGSKEEALDVLWAHESAGAPLVRVAEPGEQAGSTRLYAIAMLKPLEQSRLHEVVEVEAPAGKPALVLFARPDFGDYQARLNGEPLPVRAVDLFMPAVELPPGARGRLELVYRPRGLVWGLPISLGTLLLLLVGLGGWSWRRGARAARGSA